MIGKLSLLGFTLVTALSGTALAHENCDPGRGHAGPASHNPGGYTPAGYGPAGYGPAAYSPAGYGPAGYGPANRGGYRPAPPVEYSGRVQVDLRYSDLNRDGWVTMDEALDSGRQVFRQNDRNNDRVLTRYELGRDVRRDDRNNDGRVTLQEYQRDVHARFASLDTNRDGVLARYELGLEPPRPTRSAGWWSHR
jgi:EF hand